VTKIILI